MITADRDVPPQEFYTINRKSGVFNHLFRGLETEILNAKLTVVISGQNEGWKEKPSIENQENEKGKTDKSMIDFFFSLFLLEGTMGMKARLAKALEDKHDQQCHTYRSPLRGQTKR